MRPVRRKISESLTREMQRYAEQGYKALGLQAYGRLDFIMDKDGNMYCLEANTPAGNDAHKPDSPGGKGTGNGLSGTVRETDRGFPEKI